MNILTCCTYPHGYCKLDAPENPENLFTGSNFIGGNREEKFGSGNSFNKEPNKTIYHASEDLMIYKFLWIQIVNLLMGSVYHLMVH